MSSKRILCIAKFGKKHHLENMLKNGVLHMKRLRAFQDIEHQEIGDTNEGLSHLWQPEQIVVEINGVKLEDLSGPVRLVEDNSYNPHIFCMYAITEDHLSKKVGEYIDERCFEFGDTVLVIINAPKFQEQIRTKLKEVGGKISGGLVEYVPYDEHQGEMGPYRKFDYHKHQSEFRIVYESNIQDDVLDLEIGSLEGIAKIYPSREFNKLIEIQNKPNKTN